MPCFSPGNLIATTKGERAVEELAPGDQVVTRDNGIQEIQWSGRRPLGQGRAPPLHLWPVLIAHGSLGAGLPVRDTRLTPNHRVLVSSDRNLLAFEAHEALIPARHLIDGRAVRMVEPQGGPIVHIMCARSVMVLVNGCWTECFRPSDVALNGLGDAQRNEIFEIFPELAPSGKRDGGRRHAVWWPAEPPWR